MKINRKCIFQFSLGFLFVFCKPIYSFEIKESVRCPKGKVLLMDSSDHSDGIVDKCIDMVSEKTSVASRFPQSVSIDAQCPKPDKHMLKNNKGLPKFKENSGIGLMFDYFLMKRLKFKKVAGLGRDLCIGTLPPNELKKFK